MDTKELAQMIAKRHEEAKTTYETSVSAFIQLLIEELDKRYSLKEPNGLH